MRFLLLMAVALTVAPSADAQGPIRQGLRRTGEVAVEGTRRVVGGAADVTRGVIGGAADVTRGVVGGAADVTRGVVGGAARGVAAGVDAVTPGVPLQARAEANLQAADLGRDARWRFQQHNGEWWYYSPQNAWMYHRDGRWNQFSQETFQTNPAFAGEYSTGYRGMNGAVQGDQYAGGYQAQGPTHRLYRDRYGREYLCENGRRVYVNSQQGQEYSSAYRGMEGQGQQFQGEQQGNLTPTPAIPNDTNVPAGGQQGQAFQQGQIQTQQGQTGAATATGAGTTNTGNSGALPGEAPRDINQSQTRPETGGIIQPGDSAL